MTTLQKKVQDIDNILECYNEKWCLAGDTELKDYYAKQIIRLQKKMYEICGIKNK